MNKASGPDGIPCRILKELSVELAPVITKLFQKSLQTGKIPNDWSKANVTPIFKKGNRHLPENYRPVSLTCVLCKLMEHVVAKHINKHLEEHDILTRAQHGFRSKHSCESQLLITLHELFENWDSKIQTDVAVLDFSKAFDTVPHDRLLSKLLHYGIDNTVNNWISAFLKQRSQSVVVDGVSSSPVNVISGVPQGTVLGPLLFLLHINDLPLHVNSTVMLFADDCLLYRKIKSENDQLALQNDLSGLEKWGVNWGMRFNAKKCNVLRLARQQSPLMFDYKLGGHILEVVTEAKYLGVTISNNLTWTAHITNITNKANSTLAFLRRNLKSCPQPLKETAYKSMVRSVLEYSAAVWDPHYQKDIQALEKIQCRGARFVKQDYDYQSSVTKMLADLEWDSLTDRRLDLRLALMFKVVHGLIAVTAEDIGKGTLQPADSRTRASHQHKFKHIQTSTPQFRHSFFPRTISNWNPLDGKVAEAKTVDSFKQQLRATGSGPPK